MNLFRATMVSLAKLLSVREDQVDDALQSARLVKRHLSRRGMFQAIGAAAAAAALPSGMGFGEVTANAIRRDHEELFGAIVWGSAIWCYHGGGWHLLGAPYLPPTTGGLKSTWVRA